MKNSISTQPCHSIYPGQFVPLHNEVEIKEELKRSFAESSVTQPPVNLTESEHSVKVEIALPGVTREELLIYTDKNILSGANRRAGTTSRHPCCRDTASWAWS